MRKGMIKIHFVDKGSGPPAVHILYWGVYALHPLYVSFRGLSSCNFHFHICGDGVVPGSAAEKGWCNELKGQSQAGGSTWGDDGAVFSDAGVERNEVRTCTQRWVCPTSSRWDMPGTPRILVRCPNHRGYMYNVPEYVFLGGDKQNKVLIKNVFSLDIYYIQRTFTKQWNKCYTCTIPT